MWATRKSVMILAVALIVVAGVAATGLIAGLGVFGGNGHPVLASAPNPNLTANNVASTPNTLTVVGDGTVTAAPDQAEFSLGVNATRANVHDALNVASAEMKKLLASLHAQGVADADIQTSGVAMNQATTCCPSTVTGYTASNTVSVVVHHIANVGTVIAAAVDAVGNDVTIGGITLGIADKSTQLSAARTNAMKDANARAKQWAANAGRQLGKLIAVSEVVGSAPVASGCTQNCGSGGGGGVPIQPGLETVEVTVTVAFELSG